MEWKSFFSFPKYRQTMLLWRVELFLTAWNYRVKLCWISDWVLRITNITGFFFILLLLFLFLVKLFHAPSFVLSSLSLLLLLLSVAWLAGAVSCAVIHSSAWGQPPQCALLCTAEKRRGEREGTLALCVLRTQQEGDFAITSACQQSRLSPIHMHTTVQSASHSLS